MEQPRTIEEQTLRITEIFLSIQGESSHVGRPCSFVRLTGCPMRCIWCDSEYTFSGGEKLRLNIAAAMIKRPRLLLLDEPTASLDNASKLKVRSLIEQLKAEGTTMLGIFHDLEFMEGLCDHEFNMQEGMMA